MSSEKQNTSLSTYLQAAALCLILLTGLSVRGIYHVQHVREPDYNSPVLDPQLNDYWARALVSGDWTVPPHADNPEIRESPYGRPPGYPWLLAALYSLSQSSYHSPRILQFFTGMFLIALLYLLGSRLFDVKTGLVSAALMAVYWGNPYFEGELNSPVWECALLVGIFLLFLRHIQTRKIHLIFCTGLLCGISLLFRPNLLVVLFFMVLYLAGNSYLEKLSLRATGIRILILILAAALPVFPVLIRNWKVSGELVFISYYGGVNAYIGNNPKADGVSPTIPDLYDEAGVDDWNCFNYPELVKGLGERLNKPDLSYGEASSYFYKKAMRFWLEDPFHALALTLKKSWYFWGPHIISDSKVVHFEKEYSPVLRFLPGFTIIAALALSGLFFLFTVQRGLNQKTSLLLIFILSYFLSVLPFFMSERYRFPIVPFLLPLSALALIHLETALREKSGKHFIGKSFLILLLLILLSTELFPYKANESTWYLHRGFAFAGKQQTTEALACFEKALTVNPANGEAGLQAGYIHAARGDHDQALQFYLSALGSMPGNPYLMNNLGYEFYLKKDYPAAIRYYEQALARRQRYALAWHNLGNVFLETEEYEQARDAFQHACELDPENADSANNLGAALLRNNEVQASLEWFYRALESPSPYPRAHLNLGRALETLDRYTEAREHYESCLEYWPDNQAAVEGLMRLPSPAEAP